MLFLALPVLLSACASGVNLDKKTPVEAATAAPTATVNPDADSAAIAANAAAAKALAAEQLKNAINTAENKAVYFDFDRYDVKSEFNSVIANNVQLLKDNPSLQVNLQGNTDSRGSREYNLALGQRRSDAVQKVMQLQGVNASQIQAVSFGKEKPAVEGNSDENMALNRRVDFSYQK
jgi:peptidoglycan-associated lipoprotein